jgi:hypothetical protein
VSRVERDIFGGDSVTPNRYVGPRMTQIHWNAERKIIKWGTETADRFVPAVLRLTDNAETELEELRIETLEGETGITLIRPSVTITRRGLELSGTVGRTPPKLDWSEEWLAVPIVGDNLATSWRVEVVEDETGTTIDSGEPATLSQEWWRRDKRGHLTREEDAMLDEWGCPRGDPVERLIIRSGGDLRLVDDFGISRLLPFGFSYQGITKHKGQGVEVTINLTPSAIPAVEAMLGSGASSAD